MRSEIIQCSSEAVIEKRSRVSRDVPDTVTDDRERQRSREAQVETVRLKWSHTKINRTAAQ